MRRELLDRLTAARAGGATVALLTDLDSGAQTLFDAAGQTVSAPALDRRRLAEVRDMMAADRSGLLPGSEHLFVRVFSPPLRLLVVGAVHIAQALLPLATVCGFAVILIDPRRAWASAARFRAVEVCHDWPDEALARLRPDVRTAVVTLSHDPKLDDPALAAALASPAFYIGALGSRKTHAARVRRLTEQGFDQTTIARIHAPVGLDLGGRSPSEIALATLAQIVQTRYRPRESS